MVPTDVMPAQTPDSIQIAPPRYDTMSMALHWLSLALLILTFGAAWAREQAEGGDSEALLLMLHRSAGMALWLVTLARLAWKASAARAPSLPSSMPRWQRYAARGNEILLYVLLALQPVTGFVQSIARGKPFALAGLEMPALMERDKALVHLFHEVHENGATVMLALIGLHACAGLFHGLVLRDGVLSSMVPTRARPK